MYYSMSLIPAELLRRSLLQFGESTQKRWCFNYATNVMMFTCLSGLLKFSYLAWRKRNESDYRIDIAPFIDHALLTPTAHARAGAAVVR